MGIVLQLPVSNFGTYSSYVARHSAFLLRKKLGKKPKLITRQKKLCEKTDIDCFTTSMSFAFCTQPVFLSKNRFFFCVTTNKLFQNPIPQTAFRIQNTDKSAFYLQKTFLFRTKKSFIIQTKNFIAEAVKCFLFTPKLSRY